MRMLPRPTSSDVVRGTALSGEKRIGVAVGAATVRVGDGTGDRTVLSGEGCREGVERISVEAMVGSSGFADVGKGCAPDDVTATIWRSFRDVAEG